MDLEMTTQVFNIILTLKELKKEPYVIDKDDMNMLYTYWKLYDINKYMTIKGFRKCVVLYSIHTGKNLRSACDELCKKIIF